MSEPAEDVSGVVAVADGWCDLATGDVRRGERTHVLRPMELRLLRCLADSPGQTLPRERLLKEVWGFREGVQTRTLDTTVKNVRRKLEVTPSTPQQLITVRGVGYAWRPLARAGAAEALIGRTDELRRLRRELHVHRLVVVTGVAGVGKSALLRFVAADWRATAREVVVVDLEGVAPAEAGSAVARGCGGTGDVGALEAMLDCRGAVLVVVDGADRCVDELVPLLQRCVEACPEVRVVVGSRRLSSRVPCLRLHGLGLPCPDADTCDDLEASDAGRLFLSWVREARPDYAPEGSRAADVAALVRALAGIPLALELAAARTLVLPAGVLVQALTSSLDVLSGTRGGLVEELERSWQDLTPVQRDLMVALVPFGAGFEPGMLSELVGGAALSTLAGLIERSLVVGPDSEGDEVRFRMLQPIRSFVRQRVGPEAVTAAAVSHAAWLARRCRDAVMDPAVNLRDELDDLSGALENALEVGDPDLVGPLAHGVLACLYRFGAPGPTARLLGRLRRAPLRGVWEVYTDIWRLAHDLGAGRVEEVCGQLDHLRVRAAATADPLCRWRASGLQVIALLLSGEFGQAREAARAGLAQARDAGDPAAAGRVWLQLALIERRLGDLSAAMRAMDRAAELIGDDPAHAARVASHRGAILLAVGDAEGAVDQYRQALDLLTDADLRHRGIVVGGLAKAMRAAGSPGYLVWCRQSLAAALRVGDELTAAEARQMLASDPLPRARGARLMGGR